jgi:hypothetical protein
MIGVAIHADALPQYVRVAAIGTAPKAVAEDGGFRESLCLILGTEHAAQLRLDAQQ